jgi:hypothetical protein
MQSHSTLAVRSLIGFGLCAPCLGAAPATTTFDPAFELGAAWSQDPPPAAGQEPAPAQLPTPVRIELESLAGEVRLRDGSLGPLTSLSAEGAALVRFTGRAGLVPPTLDATTLADVELAGGDRVRGVVRAAGDDGLAVDLGGAELVLDLDELRALVFRARVPREAAVARQPDADSDVLYFVAGRGLDRAEGLLEGFDAQGLVFDDSRVGKRSYAWDRVAALFVASLEPVAASDDAASPLDPVVLGLIGGGRLSGRLRSLDTLRITLVRPGGAALELPAELMTELALADGSFTFLSDLPVADGGPLSPFGDELGFTWPHRIDRAVDGGPLRVGGKIEGRGIGVHAPSRLTWRLDGSYERLRLAVAVDDSGVGAERSGSVRFRVLGDGRELWQSGVVRGGQGLSSPPPMAVAGVRELVLEVDPDGDFVLDRANWLRPVLVRAAR